MSAPKNVTRFHYQDIIYLPTPQSLAIVLGVFKLNYQVKRDKGGNGKGRKKRRMFYLPIFIKNLEKACTRGSAVNTRHAMIFILFSSNAFCISYS